MAEVTSEAGVPTLHHLSSSQSLRVLWAFEELSARGKPYNLVKYQRVNMRAPEELKQVAPLGKSPILTIPPPAASPNSPTVVTESRLILQYISDHYSDGIWTPDTPQDQVRNEHWQEFANSSLGAMLMLVIAFDSTALLAPALVRPLVSLLAKGAVGQLVKVLPPLFAVMEAALSDQQPWFAGPKIGLADFNMSWPMDLASQRRYFVPADYPKTADWLKRVHARDAYKAARAKGGSYDLVYFDTK